MTAANADKRSLLITLIAGGDVFILDRIHKFFQIELKGWRGGEFVTVTPFFDYVLVWNPGISYGLFGGVAAPVLLLVMGAAIALLALWWWRAETFLARLGLAICMGGAASHIIDRLVYGAVPDFFHLHWDKWSFYIFNISDTAITFGVILLIVDLVTAGRRAPSQ